jgi:hypothetical protein
MCHNLTIFSWNGRVKKLGKSAAGGACAKNTAEDVIRRKQCINQLYFRRHQQFVTRAAHRRVARRHRAPS